MIEKIISGGQTGADRAALDVAMKLNIDHGGWIPKGRKTEDGPLPDRYQLKEMPTDDYRDRTRQNIMDSHGTVIISRSGLTGGSLLTQSYAKVLGKPLCVINLSLTPDYEASVILKSFILENRILILNVAGPRLSHQPWIYQDVKTVLEVALYQLYLDSDREKLISPHVPRPPVPQDSPGTIQEAVNLLSDELELKTRTFIANFSDNHIYLLYFAFQDYVRQRLGLDAGNPALIEQCSRQMITGHPCSKADAGMVIIKALKKHLESDHILRVVK